MKTSFFLQSSFFPQRGGRVQAGPGQVLRRFPARGSGRLRERFGGAWEIFGYVLGTLCNVHNSCFRRGSWEFHLSSIK